MKIRRIFIFCFILFSFQFNFASIISISNEYLRASIDSENGRFSLEKIKEDTPTNVYSSLLHSKIPFTSFVAINTGGETIIYGSSKGRWISKPYSQRNKLYSGWKYRNLIVFQQIELTHNPSTGFDDNMRVSVLISNTGGPVSVGIAIIFDLLLDNSEPQTFFISDKGTISTESELTRDSLPSYWYTYDNVNEPRIKVYGNLSYPEGQKPDRIIFANWDRLSELWNLRVDSLYDFKRKGTTKIDSAVGIFYDSRLLDKDLSYTAFGDFGIFGANIFTEEDYKLTMSIPKEPQSLPVPVVAAFANNSKSELTKAYLEIFFPEGFTLVEGEKKVEFPRILPAKLVQYKWAISTKAAGGNFEVKVKATFYPEGKEKTIEAFDSFYINLPGQKQFQKEETKKIEEIKSQPQVEKESSEALTYMDTKRKKLNMTRKKIKKIEETIEKINMSYENWWEIYRRVFKNKNYSIEQLDKALEEIEKELYYFQSVLSNEVLK